MLVSLYNWLLCEEIKFISIDKIGSLASFNCLITPIQFKIRPILIDQLIQKLILDLKLPIFEKTLLQPQNN